MMKPISKEALKAKRQLLKDTIEQENAEIARLGANIDTLQAERAIHISHKASIQIDIDNLTEDIGA